MGLIYRLRWMQRCNKPRGPLKRLIQIRSDLPKGLLHNNHALLKKLVLFCEGLVKPDTVVIRANGNAL